MKRPTACMLLTPAAGLIAAGLITGCVREIYPTFLVGDSALTSAGIFAAGTTFTETLIQERTFTDGSAVTTVTYQLGDPRRVPQRIDFNGDGKLDPVVGYGDDQAVIQILLSKGPAGTVEFTSLTLDSKRDMLDLADVAVADIDNDGNLDIIAGTGDAVWYFHHPSDAPITELAQWGNPDPLSELRERIAASYTQLSEEELQAMIVQALGPGVDLDDYTVTVAQAYTNVEAGDFDNDGYNDIVTSRSFIVNLEPKPTLPLEPIQIVDGDVLVLLNPGGPSNGVGWTALSIGKHERQQRLDRDGATGLLAIDIDGDNDLDVVSSARKDNNVQVAWFENPGGPLDLNDLWPQWRIGSIRDARSVDIADLTGDGRPDVVATGGEQMQMILFEQPADDPGRSYDWDTRVLTTFATFEPRDLKIIDLDNDGAFEIAIGGTGGAVRYFEPPEVAGAEWQPFVIATFDPPGTVGLLGYGDLDGDGDLDVVAVVDGDEDNAERITWIRNDLTLLDALSSP